ncbi:MAG TPA: hypothetical protein VF695_11690, partial [Sphingomonas sp.]
MMVSLVISLAATPRDAQGQSPAPAKLPIGMNLGGIADYSSGYPFKNLMWGARPWLSRNAEGDGPFNTELADKIPLDPNGYPLELPVTVQGSNRPQVVFTLIPNVVEPGRYLVLYDGDGEVTAAMTSKVIESKP